jgi:hypothetical protein
VLRAGARGLPEWAEGLTLEGVHAHGRRWRVHVRDGAAVVDGVS